MDESGGVVPGAELLKHVPAGQSTPRARGESMGAEQGGQEPATAMRVPVGSLVDFCGSWGLSVTHDLQKQLKLVDYPDGLFSL